MTDLEPPPGLPDDARRIWTQTLTQLLAAGTTARVDKNTLLAYVTARQHADAFTTAYLPPALAAGEPMREREPARGRWCDTHRRYECTGQRSRGRGICHGICVVGLATCRMHAGRGGKAKHIAALERVRNPLQGEPMDIGPAQALLWRVRVLAGEVARLDETVAALEAEDLVWGTVSRTDATEEPGSGEDGTPRRVRKTVEEARLNIWLQLRERREKELRLASEAALHAGVEERLVRLAESQGAAAHRVILAILADFGIPASDERIPRVVPARLRELTA